MLAASPVLTSRRTRTFFLLTALITAALLFWGRYAFPSGPALTPIFQLLFLSQDATAAECTLLVLVLAVWLSGTCSFQHLPAWISDHLWMVVVGTVILLSIGTLVVYCNHPLAMDEYAPYLQSQIFAAGKLTGKFPIALMDWLIPPYFQNYFLTASKATGDVASGYWPSWALLLAPFTALGISWTCNPLISGLTLLAAYRLAVKIYGSREAGAWTVLLTLASPEFLINGISYYSMPAHMLANTIFALLMVDPTRTKAGVAGFIGSIALTLHNPMPHALFALPWILAAAGRKDGGTMILCLAAGYLPICALLGIGWLWYTLHLRAVGVPVTPGGGILENIWQTVSVFTLPDSSIWLARAVGVAKTWIWSAPGLILLAIAGARKRWRASPVRILAYSALLTLVGYFIVPVDQGHGWGYRYFHSAWIVLPLLSAGVLAELTIGSRELKAFEHGGFRAYVLSCAVLMLLIGGALRAWQVHDFIASDLNQTPRYYGKERRVEIINTSAGFYGADLVQNDPWLRGDIIRMQSHGREQDSAMMAQNFPQLHEVYDDVYGSVWSTAAAAPRHRLPP